MIGMKLEFDGSLNISAETFNLPLTQCALHYGWISTQKHVKELPYYAGSPELSSEFRLHLKPSVQEIKTNTAMPNMIQVGYNDITFSYRPDRHVNGLSTISSFISSFEFVETTNNGKSAYQYYSTMFGFDSSRFYDIPIGIRKKTNREGLKLIWHFDDKTTEQVMDEWLVTHLEDHPFAKMTELEIAKHLIHPAFHSIID